MSNFKIINLLNGEEVQIGDKIYTKGTDIITCSGPIPTTMCTTVTEGNLEYLIRKGALKKEEK